MESDSDNESDYALSESSEDENEDVGNYNVNRIWTNIADISTHEYPHEIQDFDRYYGPASPPNADSSPLEYFNNLTIPNEGKSLIKILVDETNRYANQYLNNSNYNPKPHSRTLDWHETDEEEMSAFLGLYLSMGILKKPTIESYWNQSDSSWLYNSPGFSTVMKRDRFQLLMSFLHCNDNEVYVPRGQDGHDPCHKFRPILDLVNGTFPSNYHASRDLTIDESMVGFKGISFYFK
ncbi:hypothetical protein FSP39_004996 [Pinctada imbricata]|uniref:PiggyBac transposable element-derived protein domain-containing protein n=1 Tax=Pinctada imbricata TaxID=66713 RepID=A0AA88YUP6_PINIB|nr:hypothetical protein FSP39_004996 [Pinctada imbricata]